MLRFHLAAAAAGRSCCGRRMRGGRGKSGERTPPLSSPPAKTGQVPAKAGPGSLAGGNSLRPEAEEKSGSAQTCLDLFADEALVIPRLGHYDFRTLLLHEVEVLGFPLSVHPLDLYRDCLAGLDYVPAAEMEKHAGKRVTMIGWWVTNKMVYTKNEEPMSFISFEDTTALFETVVFPEPFRKFCATWTQTRPYILRGRVDEEFGAFTLHVEEMEFLDRREGKGIRNPYPQIERI